MLAQKPTVVDLFCGCGGFGLGAEIAGFHTLAAIDVEPNLISAYRLNFPNTKVVQTDISSLDGSDWREILGGTKPDGVIGGPPCQGFSRMGKRDANDERNNLVFEFFRQINLLKPKFFIMENVEGLLDSYGREIVTKALNTLTLPYDIVGPFVVDASDFGAATRRRRAIIIGYLSQEIGAFSLSDFAADPHWQRANIRDAIWDLPSPIPQSNDSRSFGLAPISPFSDEISVYAKVARRMPPAGLGWGKAIEWLSSNMVSGFWATDHSTNVIQRFRMLEQGQTDKTSKYPKLDWNSVSPTLRAGTGSDRGSFQAVRPIHPDQPRVITVREAARIQGFPDWFVFHPTKWHSFRMIGNSVSPKFSEKLLNVVGSKFEASIAA